MFCGEDHKKGNRSDDDHDADETGDKRMTQRNPSEDPSSSLLNLSFSLVSLHLDFPSGTLVASEAARGRTIMVLCLCCPKANDTESVRNSPDETERQEERDKLLNEQVTLE